MFGGTYYYQLFGVRVLHHLVASLVLAAWLSIRLLQHRGLPPTPLNKLFYASVAVWFVSALLSVDVRMALENIWFPLTHLLIFFIMVDLIQTGRESLIFETAFLLATLVVLLAGFQLASWYFGSGMFGNSVGWATVLSPQTPFPLASPRLFTPLGVSTWLAAYTAPLALVAFAWGASARARIARNFLWLLAALLVIVMLLTGSRGGWISLGIGSLVFVMLNVMRNQRLQQVIRRLAFPLSISLSAVALLAILLFLRISSQPGHAAGDVLRFDLWRGALGIASQSPFLGVGPGLFGTAYRLIRDPIYVDNRLGTAHNFYLNTLAETGIVGLIVIVVTGIILVHTWYGLWRNAETQSRRMHLAGAFSALVGFGAHSFFDTFTSTPLVLLALGLAAYCVTQARSRVKTHLQGNIPAAVISLSLIIIFALGLLRSDQAQAAFNSSLAGSLEAAQQAAALDPNLNLYQLQVTYLTDISDLNWAVEAYQHALTLEPTWDVGWINLAALYQRQGSIEQALDALQQAVNIDHQNGALLLWARVAETHDAASPDRITENYLQALRAGGLELLPLSNFWSATPLRQQVLETRIADYSLEGQYRILRSYDPERAAALVPAHPATAEEFWVAAEHMLTIQNDRPTALESYNRAVALNPSGDYYASRARAQDDPLLRERDLDLAQLLGTRYESPNSIRAGFTEDPQQKAVLLAAAVPPRILQQNFEGVRFAGRVASFEVLPEMRLPGPGRSVMQPWYNLAELYLDQNQLERAANVYRAILERAPDEKEAQEALTSLLESSAT